MSKYASYFTFLIALVIVISSCGEVEELLPEAPIDINIVSGPEEGAVIDYPSPTFQWKGSNNLVSEFSYRLVPHPEYQEWSQWSSDVSASFEKLDEEEYTFEVRGRYEAGNESAAPVQRHFSVDIPFDLILMVQSDKSVYSLGDTAKFTVTLRNTSESSMGLSFPPVNPLISVMEKRTGETILLSRDGLLEEDSNSSGAGNFLMVERDNGGNLRGGSECKMIGASKEISFTTILWDSENDSGDLFSPGDYQVIPGMGFVEKALYSGPIEAIALTFVYPNVLNIENIETDADIEPFDQIMELTELLFLGQPYMDPVGFVFLLWMVSARAEDINGEPIPGLFEDLMIVAYPISITIVDR